MNLGIIGASGLVGSELLQLIDKNHLNIQIDKLKLYGSIKTCGKTVLVQGKNIKYEVFEEEQFKFLDVIILCCSAELSYNYVKMGIDEKIIFIDNSSMFRLHKDVPLVIPEINGNLITDSTKLIASPNCSTTLLCMVLYPLLELANIIKVNVSTYQAASGAGIKGLKELKSQFSDIVNGKKIISEYFGRQYAMNLFSHNSPINLENGYNEEELKMMYETDKIMKNISVNATCIRVPIMRSHCESISIEFDKPIDLDDIRSTLENFPGVELCDNRKDNVFPEPINTQFKYNISVGRIRYDITDPSNQTVNLFLSGDQLLKGAALNSYQILEVVNLNFGKLKNKRNNKYL